MRLLFKQRFFSWFDSYDIYDDNGATVFTIEGKLAWGHCLHILNAAGEHIGTVQQRVLTFLPKFDLYEFDRCIGTIKKEFTFFVPHFTVEGSDWAVEGQFMEWDYTIVSASRGTVATIGKELFHWTDTYVIDVAEGEKIPRKGGPGITKSDFLVINKTDLAPYVGASLEVMERDTLRMRGERPWSFTNLKSGDGLQNIIAFIEDKGMLGK